MKKIHILLYLICLTSCNFFRSRSDIGELAIKVKTNEILDMNLCDTLVTNIFIETSSRIDANDYINVVQYIPLETHDSILIGCVDKLIIHKDRIFVLDRNIAKSIFIFLNDGSFISRISKYGKNDDEYQALRDIDIDTVSQQLVAYDRNGGKLLYYDFNGNFIKLQRLGIRFSGFKIFPDGKYLFFTDNSYNNFNSDITGYSLLIGKPEGDIYLRALKNNKFLTEMNYIDKNNCFGYNGHLYVCPRLSNAIYEVESNGKLNKIYQIHLPSGSMEDYIQMNPLDFYDEVTNKNLYYSLGGDIFVNDSVFYFSFINPERRINSLWYNRYNGNYYYIDQIQSSSGYLLSVPPPLFSFNNLCVGAIDAEEIMRNKASFLKAHKNYQGKDKISEQTLQKIAAIKEDDNPILMIYSIKWDKQQTP